ncbi:MAG: hypothetical protein WCA13_14380 [Terriglobales bacterium]
MYAVCELNEFVVYQHRIRAIANVCVSSSSRRVSGSNLGPDFGEGDNPSRDVFKTKADVVKFVQEAVADGAQVIRQQGDAGLDKTSKFGNRLAHNSFIWTVAIEHSGEHYGQLVVYYRANNLVPPDSRR